MNNEEKILSVLESIQNQISSLERNTNERFNDVDKRFNDVEERFNSMEKFISREIQSTRDELKLEIQHVYDEVKELKEDFNNIEQVTAKNWLDISRLKSVR